MSGLKCFLYRSVPCSELSRSDSSLRCVKYYVKSALTHKKRGILEGLTVADADTVASLLPHFHLHVGTDPVDFLRSHPQTAV